MDVVVDCHVSLNYEVVGGNESFQAQTNISSLLRHPKGIRAFDLFRRDETEVQALVGLIFFRI